MTGSDSVKGTGRPSQQQQQREAKVEMHSADQLRRLAIRNCHGNKSHPGSPVLGRRKTPCSSQSSSSSSSTSSLNHISHSTPPTSNADALLDSTLPPSPDNSSSNTADKPQHLGPSSAHKHNPYITRQELLHSLRRTSSNFCVGLTQTTCSSSSSSYVHYTPRHLTRTNFNPKPSSSSSGSRAATTTPDSGLGESELTLSGSREEEASDGHEKETISMVMPESHAREQQQQHRGSLAPAHGRSHRGVSHRGMNPGLPYRSVEVPAETRHRLHASMKVPRNNNRIQDTHSRDFRRTGSEGIPALGARAQRQRSPQRPCRGGGVYNLEVCHTPGSCCNQTPHPPELTSTPTATGGGCVVRGGCCAVRVPVHVAVPDKKIRLHIPLGKKTASLV